MDDHDMSINAYRDLVGEPSDTVPAILATGRSDITTLFVSMSRKHEQGHDADYLRWHSLDHRPEQQRLASIRTSTRLVSTPQCRAARAADADSHSAVDHVMIYFFAGQEGLGEFYDLGLALHEAGRSPFIMPPVERGVYTLGEVVAEPRIRTGADVLPWLPIRGMYLLVEQGGEAAPLPQGIPGVAGALTSSSVASEISSVAPGQHLTLCFLDQDPIEVARTIEPYLRERWSDTSLTPLLAAPYFSIVAYEWDRYLP
ncbi:hypothetical protein [Haliea sp. E17]|uniref:hypothetical protein n=1 Tax=Haliea sp. E17 TaxID=3401576 RepID=UPI003AAF8C22